MCDFSLHAIKSRPAEVGDKLTTRQFPLSTTGFSAPEDINVAVCLRPGTELSFAEEVRRRSWPWTTPVINHKTAIFRQINQHEPVPPPRYPGISGWPDFASDAATRGSATPLFSSCPLVRRLVVLRPRKRWRTFNRCCASTRQGLDLSPIEALLLVLAANHQAPKGASRELRLPRH